MGHHDGAPLPVQSPGVRVSLLTGSAATGIFMGGMSDLPPLEWSSLLAVPLFAAAYMLWTALSRLHLPALIRADAALGLVPLLVLGFGQWCLYLYFAGMGVPAAAIDIPRVDALTVALTPLLLAGLLLAFGWAGARWLDGHSRAFAAIVLSMFLLGAIGLVLNSLSSAEQRGRRVAAGLATHPPCRGFDWFRGRRPSASCGRRRKPELTTRPFHARYGRSGDKAAAPLSFTPKKRDERIPCQPAPRLTATSLRETSWRRSVRSPTTKSACSPRSAVTATRPTRRLRRRPPDSGRPSRPAAGLRQS